MSAKPLCPPIACDSCAWLKASACRHPQAKGSPQMLAEWRAYRSMIPRTVAQPSAPGWCPIVQHEQLELGVSLK